MKCNLNCYGDAADPVPLPGGNGNGVPAQTIETCRDYCMATADCDAVVYGEEMCYGKKNVRTSKCSGTTGDFVTEVLTRMPLGTCIVMGDPHILTFDNPIGRIDDITQLVKGDYVVMASDELKIDGRFGYSDRFPAEASLTGLAIHGPLIKDQKLVVEYRGPKKGKEGFKVWWNDVEILQDFPSTFTSADNLVKGKKDDIDPDEIHNQARHTIGGDSGSGTRPSFLFQIAPDMRVYVLMGAQTMNAVITMRKLHSDMDGYCGNFNCVAEDDTIEKLGERGLADPMSLKGFSLPPPAKTAKADGEPPKSINDCPPERLEEGEKVCKDVQGSVRESCLYDYCISGSKNMAKEDRLAVEIAESEQKFMFLGLPLPKIAPMTISPEMQWAVASMTMAITVGSFFAGQYLRSRSSANRIHSHEYDRIEDDEGDCLIPACEHQPIVREENYYSDECLQ